MRAGRMGCPAGSKDRNKRKKRDDMLPASERALRVQQSATRAKHQKRQDRGEKLPARLGCESLLNMVRHLSVLALVGSFNHILVQGLTKTGLTAEAASGPRASSGASAAGRPGSSERNVAGGPTLVSRDSDDGVSDDGVSDDDVSDDGGDNMSLPDLVASDSEDKPAMATRNLSRCTSAVPRMPTWAPTPHRVSRYQMLRHRLRALEKLHQLPPHELYKL